MRAKLVAAMPFHLAVPDKTQFKLHPYEDSGFTVVPHPPVRTDKFDSANLPDAATIDGVPAIFADGFEIDFYAESFNRKSDGPIDPPETVLFRAIESLFLRIRHVCRSPFLRLDRPLSQLTWRLKYLNDDGSELPQDPELRRGVGKIGFAIQATAITPTIWDSIHGLPADWKPPPWEVLLFDADAAFPHIGTAIVLAASSLEVFISHILDQLAAKSTSPPALWDWINDRDNNHLKQPSVEEQFSILLKIFTGHSLVENKPLWDGFCNLKTARNKFVHTGEASVGGKPVSLEVSRELVRTAYLVTEWVREKVPEDLRWTKLDNNAELVLEKILLKGTAETEPIT